MNNAKYDFSVGSVHKRILAQALPLTLAQAVQLLIMWWTAFSSAIWRI